MLQVLHFKILLWILMSILLTACPSSKKKRNEPSPQRPFVGRDGQPLPFPPGKNMDPSEPDPSVAPSAPTSPTGPRATPPRPTHAPSAQALPPKTQIATQKLGPLIIEEGKTVFTADRPAWSSWWYPLKDRELTRSVQGNFSPLQKYDKLVSSLTGQAAQATQIQNRFYDSLDQPPWAGLCDARAFAAALHPEPQRSAMIHGVCWTPKDLKALLIMTYSKVDPDQWRGIWGEPANGSQSIREDIFPQDFLKLITVELGQKKRHLLFDSDPDSEVWTEVINSAELTIRKTADAHKVSARLFISTPSYKISAQEQQRENHTGIGAIESPFIYTFDLYGKWEGSKFLVDRGEWTGDSIKSHPDFAIQLPENVSQVNRESTNAHITAEWVDHILSLAQSAPPCR
ncbi:MAG: hypothetical protein K2Q26_13505 [Bdellovibrionales bacterium]|nr:hypothetical protein [Bdellovibrionales bacterium]